ncbi:hypothetical protein QSV34_00005 [Porticoccus sp. W117]|uniref:hypothetical protein n=1 Tax=Porticoccus sp. W117 TaxID=3054777 RepID=UPI0025926634|nr:hypothetical protein [Porticoccus sp. W117]MDM3869723.1 hypothetical protein [Porticoccus sp. W117]
MLKRLVGIFTAVMFLSPTVLQAEPQWCNGKIKHVFVYRTGEVVVLGSWMNQWTTICNLNEEWKEVSAEQCKNWYSLIQTAVVTKSPAIVYYTDAPECSALPTYGNAPAPYYVMLREN